MKLGNVSQSIVSVPKYFLKNKSIDLISSCSKTETNFNPIRKIIKKKKLKNKSFFRSKDILSLNLDFNINHNPRYNHLKSFTENTKRYIPFYQEKNYKNNAEMKGTYFPDIIYMNNIKCIDKYNEKKSKSGMQQYKEYKKATNIEQKINPDLRSDLIHNTQNLIFKINMNLDLKRWNDFDSRVTFNQFHQPAYSPITDYNQNNKSNREAFSETLKEKAKGLKTVSDNAKVVIQKNLIKNELEKIGNEYEEKKKKKKIEILIENSKNNFLKLKYNNKERPLYNKKDEKFISDNKAITCRLNRTKLYKDFPTPLREEFIEKRIYKNKTLFKSPYKNSKN